MGPDVLASCDLCPRCCGVNRLDGERGFCGAGNAVEVFRYGPHHGEEPPVSGTRGSGTVFFSRCTLRCVYCQNYPWSQEGAGEEYDEGRLKQVLRELAESGCHNWNLVSPTPWLPMIRRAVQELAESGLRLPLVYNTSGFERVDVLREYRDVADIYLTDLRYSRETSAQEGSGFGGYVKAARAALEAMWELAGPLRCDAQGVAQAGTICRLLILPGRAEEAVETLHWLAERFGSRMAVSVMAQYVPAYRAATREGWDRRISAAEYEAVVEEVEALDFEYGWVQELEGSVPDDLVGFRMEKGSFKE